MFDSGILNTTIAGDLALLTLSEGANMSSPFIEIVELVPEDSGNFVGDQCTITAWGRMGEKIKWILRFFTIFTVAPSPESPFQGLFHQLRSQIWHYPAINSPLPGKNLQKSTINVSSLLAVIALLDVQSSTPTLIHNDILSIDSPTMLNTIKLML